MKRVLIIALLILVFFLLFFSNKNPKDQVKSQKIEINNYRLVVETADTDDLRIKGLSRRASLAKNGGMLFIYQTPGYYKFWMKEMQFPLDFIWIRDDKIVDITENVPVPDKNNQILPLYTSQYPADKILEVNAGLIKSLGVKIGDKIKYER